jgi:hypothetical protein
VEPSVKAAIPFPKSFWSSYLFGIFRATPCFTRPAMNCIADFICGVASV